MAKEQPQPVDFETIMLSLIEANQSIGNKTLMQGFSVKVNEKFKIKVTEDQFWQTRNELIDKGLLTKGRGKGGSVIRTESVIKHELVGDVNASEPTKKHKRKEEDALYAPFAKIIEEKWLKDNNIDPQDVIIEDTANQGRADTGGVWTRPDLTICRVAQYLYIPGKSLEVITFEIKTASNWNLLSVFESLSHTAAAHKSYLAINDSNDNLMSKEPALYDRLQRECQRFGIGLITFSDVNDFDTYETIIEPKNSKPDLELVNDFIVKQLSATSKDKLAKLIR